MYSPAVWNPWGFLRHIQSLVDENTFDELIQSSTGFSPGVDIYEEDNNLFVKLNTPGIKPEDIKLKVENNVLTITAQSKRDEQTRDKKRHYYQMNREQINFTTTVMLPSEVEEDKAEATMENGVLTITLPKKKREETGKEIKVRLEK